MAKPEISDLRIFERSLEPALLGLIEKEPLQDGMGRLLVRLWFAGLLAGLGLKQRSFIIG